MDKPGTDEMLLFLLQQYERHELLFERLVERGALGPHDLDYAKNESAKRQAARKARATP